MAEIISSIERRKKRRIGKILKIICISIIAVIVLILILIPPLIMKDMIHMHADCETYTPSAYNVEATEVKLITEDNFNLASWEVKADQPKAIVIFLSGIQNPSVTALFGHAKMLADNGFSSLLIEMRSHGRSEGDKIYLGMKEYLDTKAGVEYIRSRDEYKDMPIIVFGVSMGGAVAINSIGEIPEIDGLISASAYSSWPDVFCDNMTNMGMPAFLTAAEKPFVWLYMGFEYGFGNLGINPMEEIKKLNGRPALFMHSKGDTQVPYKSFERLMKVAPESVATYVCDGDYHFICRQDFKNPLSDVEYSTAILYFLKQNFNK
jgi:uncharacterized protein